MELLPSLLEDWAQPEAVAELVTVNKIWLVWDGRACT